GWSKPYLLVTQTIATGSADAVAIGVDAAAGAGCVVVWADQVGVSAGTVAMVATRLRENEKTLLVPCTEMRQPYVWLELESDGGLARVGRQRDGDTVPDVGLADLGVFGFPTDECRRALA